MSIEKNTNTKDREHERIKIMEEKSLKVLQTDTTFFNRLSKTLTMLLMPTKIGLNSMLINIKRNNVLKYYELVKSFDKESSDKKTQAQQRLEDGYSLYLEAIDKYIMDSIYRKVKNGSASDFVLISSSVVSRGTLTIKSILSKSGPDNFERYLWIWNSEHEQSFSLSPRNPHGQGFIAPTSINCAGYLIEFLALEITTSPSSRGCLKTSNTCLGNSASSSKNKTPRCASVISPGFGFEPPQIIPFCDAVW